MENIRKYWVIIVAAFGVVSALVVGEVKRAVIFESVAESQKVLLETNATQHEDFNKRLTTGEVWRARREGYEAAVAEMEKRNADGN